MSVKQVIKLAFSILVLHYLILFKFMIQVNADTLYLKNGRSIDGLVKNEDEQDIELDVGFGMIKFPKSQIERIDKSNTEESESLRQEWQRQKVKAEEERVRKELEFKQIEEQRPRENLESNQVEVYRESGHIGVNAVLNRRVPVSLILDTGASLVVLSNNIAKKLGIDTKKSDDMIQLQLADGRKVNAMYTLLESIGVQEIETKNVDAAVLLEDIEIAGFKDGLLGMSFLNRFNFKVNQKEKKLILEKLE